MDQKPPARRNMFILAAVILFNLIWLTLLFMSCQTDKSSPANYNVPLYNPPSICSITPLI